MSSATSESLLNLPRPILIVSSRAGLGNVQVGKVLHKELSGGGACEHIAIESLIPECLARSNFERHRWICERAPWLLYFIYGMSINYAFKTLKEKIFPNQELESAAKKLESASSIVATNHRALFWLSSLKRRGFLKGSLHGVIADYSIGWGWKSVFTNYVSGFWGPLPEKEAPSAWKGKYQQWPVPVDENYKALAYRPGSPQEVLITGGGWGLGPIEKVCAELLSAADRLQLHVVCGDNQPLMARLKNRWPNEPRLHRYGAQESLAGLMERCASIVCKPGGVTLSEAAAAQRQIFLINGLPVIEADNARYAKDHFGARPYGFDNFFEWYKKTNL